MWVLIDISPSGNFKGKNIWIGQNNFHVYKILSIPINIFHFANMNFGIHSTKNFINILSLNIDKLFLIDRNSYQEYNECLLFNPFTCYSTHTPQWLVPFEFTLKYDYAKLHTSIESAPSTYRNHSNGLIILKCNVLKYYVPIGF